MTVRERLSAALHAELHRTAARLAEQAPLPLALMTPEQAEAARQRFEQERRIGPDIHTGPWPSERRPWLRTT